MQTIYQIPSPDHTNGRVIEVYGDREMGWYEWRIVDNGKTIGDTARTGGQQYGQAEIALRDALMFESGIHITD